MPVEYLIGFEAHAHDHDGVAKSKEKLKIDSHVNMVLGITVACVGFAVAQEMLRKTGGPMQHRLLANMRLQFRSPLKQ